MVEIDTSQLREIAKDAKQLSNDYLEHIKKIFQRIDGMNSETGEWVGDSSIKFNIIATNDSRQYIRIATILSKYATKIDNIAERIDRLCIGVKKK